MPWRVESSYNCQANTVIGFDCIFLPVTKYSVEVLNTVVPCRLRLGILSVSSEDFNMTTEEHTVRRLTLVSTTQNNGVAQKQKCIFLQRLSGHSLHVVILFIYTICK